MLQKEIDYDLIDIKTKGDNKVTFDEQHPNEEVGHEIAPHVFKSVERGPCWECKTYTNYVDNIHLIHICSEHCHRVEWLQRIRRLHHEGHPVIN